MSTTRIFAAALFFSASLAACDGGSETTTGDPGGTGGAGGTGGSGGTSTGGNPFQGCPGISLKNDGVLDLDIKSVHVQGDVTLNGGPLPNTNGDRGRLYFTNKTVVIPAEVPLDSSGALHYDVTLPPGTYDIVLQANEQLCDGKQAPAMPCVGGLVKDGVSLGSDGVLDIDIPAVTVQGNVTLAKNPLPGGGKSRGRLGFRGATEAISVVGDLGTSGDAGYAVTVLPGTYAISYHGNPDLCGGADPPALPCNEGEVIASQSLTQSGVLDIDITAVAVKGAVTVNGGAMPMAGSSRGSLSFSLGKTWVYTTPQLGSSGPASYAVTLLAGTYSIGLAANESLCNGKTAPGVPCVSGSVKKDISLTSSGLLDVDLPAVKVSGAVTLAGGDLPGQPMSRGSVRFTLTDGGSALVPLGQNGALSYAMTLLRGPYAIDYIANEALCNGKTAPEMPCGDGPIHAPLSIENDGVLDLNIDRIKVSGAVTLAGSPLPSEKDSRGQISFSLDGGGIARAPLGTSGAFQYAITLLRGTYLVGLDANEALCSNATGPSVPCIDGPIRAPLTLDSDGVLDLDIPAVHVKGALTLNGGNLPNQGFSLGQLGFSLLDEKSPGTVAAAIASSGPQSYDVTLIPGSFVISHLASSAACQDAKGSGIPCASQVLRGCEGALP